MSLKNLDLSKIKVSEKTDKQPVTYKGNVTENIRITDHVLERFAQRHMNNLKIYDLHNIKAFVSKLIHEQGIKGFADKERDQYYIGVYGYGMFIITSGNVATTFLNQNDLNRYHQDLFLKLLKKGRVE